MNKFESSYSKYLGYRVACSQCKQLYVKANDEPFVCLTCAAKKPR